MSNTQALQFTNQKLAFVVFELELTNAQPYDEESN